MHLTVRGGTFILLFLTLGLSWTFISHAEAPEEDEIVVIGGLTVSNEAPGTAPKADHTIAADLSVFPLGTRLKIGECIYTVEDTGASIKDNRIDIFYDTHEEAVESGRYSMEVFLVK